MKTKARGQALTEFALILPLLLLLLLGIIEGARIAWAYITVQNAAREAARYAVSGQPLKRPDEPADCDVISGSPLGEPWSCTDIERVSRIKDVAVQRAKDLGVQVLATRDITDFQQHEYDPAALGVLVKGQKTFDDLGTPDFPGEQGLNVLVQVYYNVEMWDPIFRSLMYGITNASTPGVPNDGYYHLHLSGAVLMQNEGVDTALGALPPGNIPPEDLSGTPGVVPSPPAGADLRVNGVDNWSGPAGSTISISLLNAPQNKVVCIYWNGDLIPNGCKTTQPDGSQTYSFYIPLTDVGPYLITAVYEGLEIARESGDVTASPSPAIVTNGDRWPAGTPICIGVVSHDPGQLYNITFDADANVVGQITTDGSGNALAGSPPPQCDPALPFTIDRAPGTYWIKSWTTVGPTVIASKTITVIPTCIRLNQGECNQAQTVPAGSRVYIILSSHAPNREYNVYVVDWNNVEHLVGDHVRTDGNGEVFFYWDIDPETNWPNGNYTVISRDASLSSGRTGQVGLTIDTPPNPYITIGGGYTWPAGSSITIQLRKHCGVGYDVYLINNDDPDDVTLVGEDFDPDPPGSCTRWITWTIPNSKVTGSYRIESRQGDSYASSTFVARVDLDIEAVPTITIDGGNRHLPGTDITIRLSQHAANNVYDVYLINTDLDPGDPNYAKLLQTVTTSPSGEATLPYSIAPDDPGHTYVIQSRQGSEVVAETTLVVVPADLEVTDIQIPTNSPLGVEFPITVTIRNNADVNITGRSFDVDIYLDPPEPPPLDTFLPPGDRKQWVSSIPANSSITVVDNIALYGGSSHTIYARADTTNYIIETDENNNMLSTLVPPPPGCTFEITDTFESSLNPAWQLIRYNNADLGSGAGINSGLLRITTDGSGTWNSNDETQGGFAMLARALQGNYDFDVVVHLLRVPHANGGSGNGGKAGLTVRDGREGRELKVDWTWYDRVDNGLQAGYRDTFGGNTSQAGSYVRNSGRYWINPVWLRIRRAGSTFIYSYATTTAMPAMNSPDWTDATQITVEMDDDILVGLLATPYDDGDADYGEYDNFYMCVREASPPTEFPPGYQQCTQVIENGRLEDPPSPTNATGWLRNEDGSVVRNTGNPHWVAPGERYAYAFRAESVTGIGPMSPWVYQEVVFPNWMNATTTGVLTLHKGVYWVKGSQRPGDVLQFNLRSSPAISLSVPITIATGADTPNYPPPPPNDPSYRYDNGKFVQVITNVLASSLFLPGNDPVAYAGQTMQAWFYAPNPGYPPGHPNVGDNFETEFWLDNISLDICTTQEPPSVIPGTGRVSGKVMRIPPGRPPEIVPGTLVWIWAEDVPLQTTYVIQDGTYSFYNLPPAERYKVYFQYEDIDRTYWYLATIDVGADANITLNVTLF
jgi:hypothetical protein